MSKKNQPKGNNDGPRKLSAEKRDENYARTRAKKARKHAERYAPKDKDPKECLNPELERSLEEMSLFLTPGPCINGAVFPDGGVPICNWRTVPVRKNGKFVYKKGKNGKFVLKNGKKVKATKRVCGKPTGSFHGLSTDLGGFRKEQQDTVLELRHRRARWSGVTSEWKWVVPQSEDWHTPIKEGAKKLPHLRETLAAPWHVEAKFGEETEDGFVVLNESNYEDYTRAVSYLQCSLRKEKRQQEIARKRIKVRERQKAEEERRKKRADERRKQKWAKKQAQGWAPRRNSKNAEKVANRPPVHWK